MTAEVRKTISIGSLPSYKRTRDIWDAELACWTDSIIFNKILSTRSNWKGIGADGSLGTTWTPRKNRPARAADFGPLKRFPSMVRLWAYATQREYMDQHLASTAEENQNFAIVESCVAFKDIKRRLAQRSQLTDSDRLDLVISLYLITLLSGSYRIADETRELKSMCSHLYRFVCHCLSEQLSRLPSKQATHFAQTLMDLMIWQSWDLSESFRAFTMIDVLLCAKILQLHSIINRRIRRREVEAVEIKVWEIGPGERLNPEHGIVKS